MIWFLIIVGLVIFAPILLVVIGAGALLLVIPFAVFFGVWGLTTYTILQTAPTAARSLSGLDLSLAFSLSGLDLSLASLPRGPLSKNS